MKSDSKNQLDCKIDNKIKTIGNNEANQKQNERKNRLSEVMRKNLKRRKTKKTNS